MQIAQCFYDVETARSRFYPNIKVTGTAAFTNSGGGAIVNPGKWLLSAVGSLVQPIFQHGQLVAGLKVAKAQYEQAYNNWQSTVLKAGNEVSNALVTYNSSAEKAELDGKGREKRASADYAEDVRLGERITKDALQDCARHGERRADYERRRYGKSHFSLMVPFSTAMKADCGTFTWPNSFILALPRFCFSRTFILRVTSPP